MSLAAAQSLFWQVVAERKPVSRDVLESVFVGTAELSVVGRLEIYGAMYVHRLVDALAGEFPELRERLGEDEFFATAEAYIRRYPSEHASIAHVGRYLPRFLRAQGRRELADLATLERTRSLVFDARDETPLAADALTHVAPDRLGDTVLVPIAALALVKSTAVFRRGFMVHDVELGKLEARALRLLRRGATLGELCEVFVHTAEPAVAAFEVIGRWFASGWIAAIR